MSLDLNKLANKLDEALSNETSETLNKFLTDKRMSNNKQDSVEFLWEQLKQFLPEMYTVDESVKILSILKQAKAMQKEQRINDFRAGIDCESDHHGYMWTDKNYPEQWYIDLQKGNNE